MSLILDAAGLTDVGLVRASNEDSFGYDERLGIFVVCDGMGGHAAGEVASRIAVDTVLGYFREHEPAVREDAYLNDAPLGARMLAEASNRPTTLFLSTQYLTRIRPAWEPPWWQPVLRKTPSASPTSATAVSTCCATDNCSSSPRIIPW